MLEVELKFQIPEARRQALLKALDPKKSEQIHLQAKYYDTLDLALGRAGAALRQRLEGTRWIQTLKAASQSHFHRFEHNHDLGECDQPYLDLSIYQADPEAKQILEQALKDQTDALDLYFETDIQRTSRVMHFNDTAIELSLDVGVIRSQGREIPVHEIEFELKIGSEQDLLEFSFEWVKKYQLWLDVRSKAELGSLLAKNLPVNPAKQAPRLSFNKKSSPDQTVRQFIGQQLQHLMPNIAAMSAQVATADHVEQAQLALTNLYHTVSLLNWSDSMNEKWAHQLAAFKQYFEQQQHLLYMQKHFAALLQNPKTQQSLQQDLLYSQEKLSQLVRSTQNVHHFLELLIFSLAPSSTSSLDLKTAAVQTLQQQYKGLHEQSLIAEQLETEALEQLAQHVKQLSFSFPLLTQIYDVKNLQKYSKFLQDAELAAQEYLCLTACSHYLQQTDLEASDWFILGWLAAKQESHAEKLLDACQQFLVSRKFLKI